MKIFTVYPSPLGPLVLTASESGLTGLTIASSLPVRPARAADHPVFLPIQNWLDAYFRGECPSLEGLPLCPIGTEFQMAVWDILRQIPWGKTLTYGEIARQIARDRGMAKMSPQAVGQAVGANPLAILIPCHRCIGAGGRLTGYAWGLDKKIWLLRHEHILKEESSCSPTNTSVLP